MWNYGKRLSRDLPRWQANGWVSAEGAREIAKEAAASGRGIGLAGVLGILAAVLLGFAAVSFVAAHWADMPRLGRLGLILGAIAAGYGAAGVFAARGARLFSDAAILFSVALFGVGIALISQMFHIDGHLPDGALLWALGALLAGVALRSNSALAFALILFGVWSGMEMADISDVHWPFLLGWLAVSAAFVWQRWWPGVHLSGLALSVFAIVAGYAWGRGGAHDAVMAAGTAALALGFAIPRIKPAWEALSAPIIGYGLATAFAGSFALQFIEGMRGATLVLFAAVTLIGLLGAIIHGLRNGQRGLLWIAYSAFSLDVLALYWKTVGSLMGTSLFFLIAGGLIAALAFLAFRLANREQMVGLR